MPHNIPEMDPRLQDELIAKYGTPLATRRRADDQPRRERVAPPELPINIDDDPEADRPVCITPEPPKV